MCNNKVGLAILALERCKRGRAKATPFAPSLLSNGVRHTRVPAPIAMGPLFAEISCVCNGTSPAHERHTFLVCDKIPAHGETQGWQSHASCAR